MTRYIALLRAINVGGYRRIKMEDLRNMFTEMDFEDVETYIQSGNVIFNSGNDNDREIADRIERQIEEIFGHDVPVLLRTATELDRIVGEVPFKKREGWMRYITFLPEAPPSKKKDELESMSGEIEQFRVANREVYSFVDKQTEEKTDFSNSFIEKQFGLAGTTRNLRTVNRILELAGRD